MEWNAQMTVARAVTGLVVAVVLVSGPLGGVDLVAPADDRLGDGTASVTVLEPADDRIRVTDGRFGTGVSYLRLPDLVADVEGVDGRPRLLYTVAVPGLDVERTATKVLTAEGRVRVPVEDRALPSTPERATYRGFLRVRVQSFTTETTVVNRSIEVTVHGG